VVNKQTNKTNKNNETHWTSFPVMTNCSLTKNNIRTENL
jgi:hypothetical protein